MELAAVRISLSTDLCAAHAARVVVLVTVRQDQEEGLPHWVCFLAARTEEARRLLRLLLEEKFAPLSPGVIERLNGMSLEAIEQLLRAALRANSLRELGLENDNGAPA